MHKRLMLIINPAAGRGGYKTGLAEVLEVFYKGGYVPSVYYTDGPGNAAELIRNEASNYDVVACIGGDGTLSEVISGCMAIKTPPILGYIPMGTANDIASTLKLSRNPTEAAKRIVYGDPMLLDVGLFGNSDYFTYIAAFGAFTEVSYKTPQETKQALGHLAYLLEGMASLPKIDHYFTRVEYDRGVIEGDFVFGGVTNSTSVAGLVKLNGNVVDLGDGLFEVLLIKNPINMKSLNGIISDVLKQNYSGEYVTMFKSKKVRFLFDTSVAWTRDGENGGVHTEVVIENIPSAVRIIA
jgi:diacylglycerol kinase (ATP)